jgi:hypothetical protein
LRSNRGETPMAVKLGLLAMLQAKPEIHTVDMVAST